MKIEDTIMRFEKLSYGNINFLPQLFENGWIIACVNIKDNMILLMRCFFCGLSRNTNSFSR